MPLPLQKVDASKFMLEKLAASGLTAADAKQLGIKPVAHAHEISKEFLYDDPGFHLPYYDASGAVLATSRFRYANPRMGARNRLVRYMQPSDTPPAVYLPRFKDTNWQTIQQNAQVELLITEGELKAACATKAGHPCIGLGGVWSFGSKARGLKLLPELEHFVWQGRTVYICYDSDRVNNDQVQGAEHMLARTLQAAGAQVRVVSIPPTLDGTKVGLDDYLVPTSGRLQPDLLPPLLQDAGVWEEQSELYLMNNRVAYVLNQDMIVRFPQEDSTDPEEKHRHVYIPVETFYRNYQPLKIMVPNAKGELTAKSAAKLWFDSPLRREYMDTTYQPGAARTLGSKLNIWTGWGADPVAGDVTPWLKYLDILFTPAQQAERHYLCQWLAYPLQHPGTKLNVAVVLWSPMQGNGKSTLGVTMEAVYGRQNTVIAQQGEMDRDFNGWLADCQLVRGEELTGGKGREYDSKLKNMISGGSLLINRKGKEPFKYPNRANFIITSNYPDSVIVDENARRFFIHELTNPPMPELWWHKQYAPWLYGAGAAALHAWLLAYPTTDFDPGGQALRTQAFSDAVDAGLGSAATWIRELKQHPDNVLRMGQVIVPHALYTAEQLMEIYRASSPQAGNDRIGVHGFTRNLTLAGFKRVNEGNAVELDHNIRRRVWAIRNPAHMQLGFTEASTLYMQERGLKRTTPKHKSTRKVGKK